MDSYRNSNMKCTINKNNEITSFWEDKNAPEDALNCDIGKAVHAKGGLGETPTYFYKLEDGKVISTTAGIEWNAQEYARNRQAEFPSIKDLVVALYDTDDKSAIEAKRAAVKAKYPKPS